MQAEVRTALKGGVDEAIAEATSAAEAFFELRSGRFRGAVRYVSCAEVWIAERSWRKPRT